MSRAALRVAWLFPSLEFANYWHPILSEFTKIYPNTTIYTGAWNGFSSGFENAFVLKQIGKMKFVDTVKSQQGYSEGFIYASPSIVLPLLRSRPDVIFTTGFCIWTLLVLLLKPMVGWQVVIAYEGSAPGVDYRSAPLRLRLRQWMGHWADAFITNSRAGKQYLTDILSIAEQKIFARPYQVSDASALLKQSQPAAALSLAKPIFLFTGQVVPRKGIQQLLEACTLLKAQGYEDYTLLIAGEGAQRQDLEVYAQTQGLQCVHWLGWVGYGQLGTYFQQADVFILPTLEDTWGMVTLEAMVFGKPVLCSKWAGSSEMVVEGENGYLFDPYQPEATAAVMRRFLEHPEQIGAMGQRSKALMAQHTPETAAHFLTKVAATVTGT